MGRVIVNVAPPCSLLKAAMLPPWRATMGAAPTPRAREIEVVDRLAVLVRQAQIGRPAAGRPGRERPPEQLACCRL